MVMHKRDFPMHKKPKGVVRRTQRGTPGLCMTRAKTGLMTVTVNKAYNVHMH